jgi:type II secretory pathway pseudopilin PulG
VKRLRADEGMTLVETMVAALVGLLVMGAAATLFSAALRTTRTTNDRVTAVNSARVSVESIGRTLRTAIRPSQLGDGVSTSLAVLEATGSRLRFYANVDNATEAVGPSRVTYDLTGGTLVQSVQRPISPVDPTVGFAWCDDTLSSCPVLRKVLATGVASGSGFTYYATDGSAVLPGVDGLDATQRELVNSVDVRVSVAGSGTSGSSTAVTRVELVNTDAYRAAAT